MELYACTEGLPNRRVQSQLLEVTQEHCLSQVVNIHTCDSTTLDLLLTNFSSPVNRVKGMPQNGKADHGIVYVEYDIKAKRIQQAPRKIYLYKRADMEGLHDHLARYRVTLLSSDHSHLSVKSEADSTFYSPDDNHFLNDFNNKEDGDRGSVNGDDFNYNDADDMSACVDDDSDEYEISDDDDNGDSDKSEDGGDYDKSENGNSNDELQLNGDIYDNSEQQPIYIRQMIWLFLMKRW